MRLTDYKYISPDRQADKKYYAGKGNGFQGIVEAYYSHFGRHQFLNYKIEMPKSFIADMQDLLRFVRFRFPSIEAIETECNESEHRIITSYPFKISGFHFCNDKYDFYILAKPCICESFKIYVYQKKEDIRYGLV